jgi:hypothetical protein
MCSKPRDGGGLLGQAPGVEHGAASRRPRGRGHMRRHTRNAALLVCLAAVLSPAGAIAVTADRPAPVSAMERAWRHRVAQEIAGNPRVSAARAGGLEQRIRDAVAASGRAGPPPRRPARPGAGARTRRRHLRARRLPRARAARGAAAHGERRVDLPRGGGRPVAPGSGVGDHERRPRHVRGARRAPRTGGVQPDLCVRLAVAASPVPEPVNAGRPTRGGSSCRAAAADPGS